MKVRLKNAWFAPSPGYVHTDKRVFSGRHYKKGVHEIPLELKSFLPTDAVILDENGNETTDSKPRKQPSLKDFDGDRANAEQYNTVVEKADKAAKATKMYSKVEE